MNRAEGRRAQTSLAPLRYTNERQRQRAPPASQNFGLTPKPRKEFFFVACTRYARYFIFFRA